jgi:hypothetical protein
MKKHTYGEFIVRQLLTVLTLSSFIFTTFGCQSTKEFLVSERNQIKPSQKIYAVGTLDGKVMWFDSDTLGYAILRDTTIEGFMKDSLKVVIPLSTVRLIHTKEIDTGKAVVWIVLGIGVVTLIVLLSIPDFNGNSFQSHF